MKLKPRSTVHNPRALLYKRFTDLETSIASNRITLYQTDDGKVWEFSGEMAKFLEYDGDTSGKTIVSAGGLYSLVYLKFAGFYFVYKIKDGVGEWTVTSVSADNGGTLILSYTDITTSQFFARKDLDRMKLQENPTPSSVQITTSADLEFVWVIVVKEDLTQVAYYRGMTGAGTGSFSISQTTNPTPISPSSLESFRNKVVVIAYVDENYPVTEWDFSATIPIIPQETLAAKFADIARYQTNKYYFAGSFDYMIRGTISSSDTQPIKGNIMHLRSFEIKYFDDNINIDHDDLIVIDGHLYGVEELAFDVKRTPKPYKVYFATLNNIK